MVRKCVGTEPTYRPATVNRARGRETQKRLGVTSKSHMLPQITYAVTYAVTYAATSQ